MSIQRNTVQMIAAQDIQAGQIISFWSKYQPENGLVPHMSRYKVTAVEDGIVYGYPINSSMAIVDTNKCSDTLFYVRIETDNEQ